jgi:hypothetical protein
MMVTLTDQEVRQALINYVTNELMLNTTANVELLKMAKARDGSYTAQVQVEATS